MLHLNRKITKSALLSAVFLFMLSSVSANPNFTYCQESPGNYTPNSPFGINLRQILNTLTLQTPKNRGFYKTSVSNNSNNSVYARALCRGDVSSKTCGNCVQNAGGEIMNTCPTEKAIIWSESCQIEYSYSMMSVVYTGKYPLSNAQEKNATDPARFREVLLKFMTNLSTKGAYDKTMFATGKIKVSGGEKIHGLVQCTRDVSAKDCLDCLNFALADLDACCGYKQGGTIFSRNCNLRFQLYQFYRDSSSNWESRILLAVGLVCGTLILLAGLIGCYIIRRRKSQTTPRVEEERGENALLYELVNPTSVALSQEGDLLSSEELTFMELKTINAATDHFSDSNKLGQGGFGTVHKGVLPDGKEVAVKRLARKSWQGLEEFKNEVRLIAKLQHRNLVRLVGCGIEGEEKLLVYEYMPNRSLDLFIFDTDKRKELSWDIRLNVIHGIARGLLYLHEDSRLKIIHRDLKPSNVLLDLEMVAKISDFGMARIFGEDQNAANTRRVVGTYGYMAPEYAMQGRFSVKSDVFSFGVILLEIIGGRRNSGFYLTEQAQSLLAYAWKLWSEGRELEFLDPLLTGSCPTSEVVRCIHIGLLCVQEDPADRLDISSVVVLLGSDLVSLPEPRQPAFSVGRFVHKELLPSSSGTDDPSLNQVTISSILPR